MYDKENKLNEKLEKPQFDMETIIDNCLVHMQNPRKKEESH